MDAWDGYKAGRDRLLAHVRSRRVPDPIVLTGDVHRSWVADLKADFDDPASATIGSEFVGSSISTTGDSTAERQDATLASNPHLKFNRKRVQRVQRVQRVWREEGLRVAQRTRKRRRLGDSTAPEERLRAERPGHVWAFEFSV